MANQPPVPTPWPAARASPTPPQSQPPSPPQSKPPSPSRSPPATPTEIPIRRIRARPPLPSPSRSWKSSQKQPAEQPSMQQPSPSSKGSSEIPPTATRSRSPSPPQEASEPQQEEAATQEVSQAPSSSTPSVLQPNSPAKKPVEPQPQESQPTVEALSQTTAQPQPEPSTRPQAQEQIPSQPAPQRTEAGNQPTENLQPKTVSVDTVLSSTREPKEIKEENSTTNRELKHEPPLVEEGRQSMESEEDREVEEKPKKEEDSKQNIQTSHQPQVERKPEKNMEPRSPESEIVSEGHKGDEPKTKAEVQPAKKSTLSSDESKKRMDIMSSAAEPDPETSRLHPTTSEPVTQLRSSEQQANLNGSKGREKTMGPGPTSTPLAPSSPGERASFHKEIKEGISKLVQKLHLGQLQQKLGSEGAIRIINLAGENKGATMLIGHQTASIEGVLHTHRGQKLNNNKAKASSGAKEMMQKQLLNHAGNKNPAATASINSNVQSTNNSLLHECSCSGGDPGVHLVFSIKPGKPLKLKENAESN